MQSDYRTPNRPPATIYQAINPVWWAGDIERNPQWSAWRWFLRNPFANFKSVVIGVQDTFRTVYWRKGDGWTYAPSGWNWGGCKPAGWKVTLPFISYRGAWIEFAVGWMTSGGFSTSLRRANSQNAPEQP